VRLAKLLMLSATIATATLGAAAAGEAQANTLSTTIAPMPLNRALEQFAKQTGLQVVYVSATATGVESAGAAAGLTRDAALRALLSGTGLKPRFLDENTVTLIKAETQTPEPIQIAQATPPRAAVETVTVTSSKLGGADVQSIPIAITALSQEQLTATQTAGGPDLVKQVPNLTFTKTNFTGYSINIRGIGTQAISVTTDPAVAVALNDMPFIRNHFFEQEFYDVGQLEVLRGPQGTLYGRNATGGVVNLVTAKPTDQFEAMASAELGSYHQKRFEGLINIPVVDDRLDIRLAGEWTKRQGYSYNSLTEQRIDGRDLWSGRLSIAVKPIDHMQTTLIWEHFSENDDRLRSSKQLCHRAPDPAEIGGRPVSNQVTGPYATILYVNQGCTADSLYSPGSFQTPNGYSLTYYAPTNGIGNPVNLDMADPYAGAVNSPNLRVIQSTLEPTYKAKNDIFELNTDYDITPELTFTSQTGFNHDFLWSTEDYNRFNTVEGAFSTTGFGGPQAVRDGILTPDGYFCDPQLGCTNRLVAEDLNEEHSWQLSQEFRLASHFGGPFNFSVGGNYMHYETHENYYVFINTLTLLAENEGNRTPINPFIPGESDNLSCQPFGAQPGNPAGFFNVGCIYIDPNPIGKLNDQGHNYFLSQNPYTLNSYAGFGEVDYDVFKNLKLTGGLRWTEDRKHFPLMPSWLVAGLSFGYPVAGVVDQQWDQLTGRAAINWTPQLGFTDQTLIYGSYAHGYKAGGANPPLPVTVTVESRVASVVHPLTFDPEFIDAFEIGSKNTLLDGALTLNGSAFYYNYENYQISEIVDRTALNRNFDAHVKGAELEATYEPVPSLRFNLAAGYENARLAKGSKAIDLMDRTAGTPGWMVVKPYPTVPSNCVMPVAIIAGYVGATRLGMCGTGGWDLSAYDPTNASNNLEGFYKDLSNNEMPNAPPWTLSLGAQYSMPITSDWAATLRSDLYWQDASYWRVFNDMSYDKLHAYSNLNLTLILTNQAGWQVMLYDKNVFNTTAITGAFLNSDDSGLTTNVFMTDPKLIGIRVTKNW
jgi:outer membrane receptor protein involved in Fe transport